MVLSKFNFTILFLLLVTFLSCKKRCGDAEKITFLAPIIAVDDEAFRKATGNLLGDGPLLFNDSLELINNVQMQKITNVNTTKYSYIYLAIFANQTPARPHKLKLQLIEEQTKHVIQIKFCAEKWGKRKAREYQLLLQTEKLNNKPVELNFIHD